MNTILKYTPLTKIAFLRLLFGPPAQSVFRSASRACGIVTRQWVVRFGRRRLNFYCFFETRMCVIVTCAIGASYWVFSLWSRNEAMTHWFWMSRNILKLLGWKSLLIYVVETTCAIGVSYVCDIVMRQWARELNWLKIIFLDEIIFVFAWLLHVQSVLRIARLKFEVLRKQYGRTFFFENIRLKPLLYLSS